MEAKKYKVSLYYDREDVKSPKIIARWLSLKKAIRLSNRFIQQSGLSIADYMCPIGDIFHDGTMCTALQLYRNNTEVAIILLDEDTSSSSFEQELKFIKTI